MNMHLKITYSHDHLCLVEGGGDVVLWLLGVVWVDAGREVGGLWGEPALEEHLKWEECRRGRGVIIRGQRR